jgi:hypothetical protein
MAIEYHGYDQTDFFTQNLWRLLARNNYHCMEVMVTIGRFWVSDVSLSPTSAANVTLQTSSPRKCTTVLIFVISAMLLCVAQATTSNGFYLMFQTLPNLPHLHPFWHNPRQRSPSLAQACSMSWLPIPVCEYPLPYPASSMPAIARKS